MRGRRGKGGSLLFVCARVCCSVVSSVGVFRCDAVLAVCVWVGRGEARSEHSEEAAVFFFDTVYLEIGGWPGCQEGCGSASRLAAIGRV